jgi:hypothetical protein
MTSDMRVVGKVIQKYLLAKRALGRAQEISRSRQPKKPGLRENDARPALIKYQFCSTRCGN